MDKQFTFEESIPNITGCIGDLILYEPGYRLVYTLQKDQITLDIFRGEDKAFTVQQKFDGTDDLETLLRVYTAGIEAYTNHYEDFIIDEVSQARGYCEKIISESSILMEDGNLNFLFAFSGDLDEDLAHDCDVKKIEDIEGGKRIEFTMKTDKFEEKHDGIIPVIIIEANVLYGDDIGDCCNFAIARKIDDLLKGVNIAPEKKDLITFENSITNLVGCISDLVLYAPGYKLIYTLEKDKITLDILLYGEKAYSIIMQNVDGKLDKFTLRVYPPGVQAYFKHYKKFVQEDDAKARGYYEKTYQGNPIGDINDLCIYGNLQYLFVFSEEQEPFHPCTVKKIVIDASGKKIDFDIDVSKIQDSIEPDADYEPDDATMSAPKLNEKLNAQVHIARGADLKEFHYLEIVKKIEELLEIKEIAE